MMRNRIFYGRCMLISILLVYIISVSAKTKTLVILHTNDTHSTVMPLNANLADTLLAGRGGFLRRVAMVKEQRKQNPDLLLFDSGDFSQGSPYYTLFKGDVEIGLMNRMGYDAATIGNHEFDYGLDNLARLVRLANFPIICSNYDLTGSPLDGIVKPYIIIKRKGIKLGVFALDPKMEGLVPRNNYGLLKYLDPVKVANETATLLKNSLRCDYVICISHLGWDEAGMNDIQVISSSRNIDLVLGGHSHSYLKTLKYVKNLDGKEIPVDQNGKHGIYVGKMVLNFTK